MNLGERQEALVRALVAGEPLPEGFDERLVGISARALLRKRAGEVMRAWPRLEPYRELFIAWAEGRPTLGSWRDGWEFARAHKSELDEDALDALAVCEALWVHGETPRRRKGPAMRRVPGGIVVTGAGRVLFLRRLLV